MARCARAGIPALVIGCVTLADALAARLVLRADAERVYILGRPIEWVCGLRSRFGLPCPTCGLTRSVVMSLHGQFGSAWKMAPVGPVAVCGLVTFALAMLVLSMFQGIGAAKWEARFRAGIRDGALIYAAAATVIWLGGWAAGFHEALLAAR